LEAKRNQPVKELLNKKPNWDLLMENGKFYKIGLNALYHVVVESHINKECVSLLKMEVNHVREIQFKKNHATNNHVIPRVDQVKKIKINYYQQL
jgi:hypothetical protein